MLPSLQVSTALWLSLSPARADIAPESSPGEQFTTYTVRLEGLSAFPEVVFVLHDKSGGEIHRFLAFTAEKPEHQIANGSSSRESPIGTPDLFVMPRAAYETWAASAIAEIARQENACSERGEGCAHISRFVPHFAAPTGTTACNAALNISTSTPSGGADAFVDVFQVEAAAPGTCTLKGPARIALRDGKPISTEARCAALTAGGSATGALVMLVGAALQRRRRRHQG